VVDEAPVGLELRLAGAPHADAATELLEVRPHAGQARQHVLQLRQLHLHPGLARAGPRGEDVEDQLGAVHDARVDRLLDVLSLRGRQLVVEDDERRVPRRHELAQLLDLALAEVRTGVGAVELLRQAIDHLGAGRVGEPLQLVEMLVHVVLRGRTLERRADEDGALHGLGQRDDVAGDGYDSGVTGDG
jgi:hypothetical protein